jgi:23S rRNA (uracil1939-C5)-methyltransferase
MAHRQEWPRYTYSLLLSIEKLIYGGDGLARTPPSADGRCMAVFVPFVLPGEKVDAELRQQKAGFARTTARKLIVASPYRVEASCPYFGQCGGCHYQHIPYQKQLEFKAGILRETLQRIAKIDLPEVLHPHPSPPWNYRNRTRLQVRTGPEFALGYFQFGSHNFLPVSECPISSPLLNQVISQLIKHRGFNCPEAIQEIELFVNGEDEQLLAWAFCGREADGTALKRWSDELMRGLPQVVGVTFFPSHRRAEHEDDDAMASKAIAHAGAKTIRYRTKSHDYQVSAGAFFQVNRHLIDDLVSVVTGNARGTLALDLYAGGGLFSAALARNFHHIFGVEASQTSHSDFVQNVPANVKAVGARTEDYLRSGLLKSGPVKKCPDLVVLDPPRTGAGKSAIRSLVELGAPRIRYVSCDPATLARDIGPLVASGYRIEEAHLFDLFPETFHIESVMLLAR